MEKIISFSNHKKNKDQIWAVAFPYAGKQQIASIYIDRKQALLDCYWRQKEVNAYKQFLQSYNHPIPRYSVISIYRAELPKRWRPLPALGFLFLKA